MTLYLRAILQVQAPGGGGGGGLIFGGAYFLNFRVSHHSTNGYLVSFRPFGFAYFSGYYTVCGKTVSHQLNLM